MMERDNHDQKIFDELQQEVWDLEGALEATTTKLDEAESRIKRLEEALMPFCHVENNMDSETPDEAEIELYDGITAGDLRRARAALEDK